MKTIKQIIKENKLIKKTGEVKEIKEYDKNGNLIHYKDSDGYEGWAKYDKNGNLIHCKDSDGYSSWREYDKDGEKINYLSNNRGIWKLNDEELVKKD